MQLKTESGERSDVITNRQLRDLALNGRNILDLMKVLPGVVSNVSGFLTSSSSAPTVAPVQPQAAATTAAAGSLSPPTAQPVGFSPSWVRNYEITDMWSGPEGQALAVNFGKTSAQFCTFLVVQPRNNARLYVLNPNSNDYFWIDQTAVGPADPPESQPGQRAPDQNCSSADVR